MKIEGSETGEVNGGKSKINKSLTERRKGERNMSRRLAGQGSETYDSLTMVCSQIYVNTMNKQV